MEGSAMAQVRLCDAAEQFERFQFARRLAPRTIESRMGSVRALVRVTGDIYCQNVTHRHVEKMLSGNSWAPRTVNARIAHLGLFFEFCRARRLVRRDHDPMLGWRFVKVPEAERLRIPLQEWGKLFAVTETAWEELSLACGLFLFLRSSELMGIQLKHVHLSEGLVEIHRKKTKQWDTMPIPAELDSHLRRQLTWLAERGATEPEHYLLPNRDIDWEHDPDTKRFLAGTQSIIPTQPLKRPHLEVQRVLRRAGYALGYGEGMHTLRRSGARAYFDSLLSQGYDGALRRVQSMLGHSSSAMTEGYLGLTLDRQARNADLAGKPMFPQLAAAKQMRQVQ
jgi:integrase